MSMRYSRVTTSDDSGQETGGVPSSPGGRPSSLQEQDEARKRERAALAERISNKIHAALWTGAAIAVMRYTRFFRVLLTDDRVDRIWLRAALLLFSANCVIFFYLTVWLPHVKRVTLSWNVYCPRAIPSATLLGLGCTIALNLALWDVWGFLTPLILIVVFLGLLLSLHFVPWPSPPSPAKKGSNQSR